MIVCGNCGWEMNCIKTGMDVLVNPNYAYRGDKFQCRECGAVVVVTGKEGNDYRDGVKVNEHTVKLKQKGCEE